MRINLISLFYSAWMFEDAYSSHRGGTYDWNGNQIREKDSVTGQSLLLGYDADNRLSRYAAKEGDAVVLTQENQYNRNGQRIQKKGERAGYEGEQLLYQGSSMLYAAAYEVNRTASFIIDKNKFIAWI